MSRKCHYAHLLVTEAPLLVLLAASVVLVCATVSVSAAPASPSVSLSAGATTQSSVSLSWTASRLVGLKYYTVYYGLSSTALTSSVNAATATSYVVTGLSPSTTYYFQVKATLKSSVVSSSVVSATTKAELAVPAPAAPTGLNASAVSSSQINLSWTDASSNETGFRIERASTSTGPFSQIATVGAGVTSYSNTGLTASTTYYYRVCAYNASGNSPYSNTVSATTQSAQVIAVPSAPTNLTATAASATEINLAWQDTASNETGFKVEQSASLSTGYVEIATLSSGSTSYKSLGLTEGTYYYYRVRAYNAGGYSGYSNTAYAKTRLVPPSNLKAIAASPTLVNLTWSDNSTKEASYLVERSTTSSSGPWTTMATLAANSVSYSDASCQGGVTYYYRVTAQGTTYDPSDVAQVTTPVPFTPKWISRVPAMGEPRRITMVNGFAYVTSSLGFQIVDVSNPGRPLVASSLEMTYPYDVAVSGSFCYVGDSKSLKVINIADQYNPVVVATLAMPDYAQDVFVAGTRAYVACYMAGLAVVDIANPYSPRIVGIVDTPSAALAVSAAGNTAVVADGTAVLTIDVSVASAPRIIGSLPTTATAVDVQVSNGYAYAAATTAGMLVINISNPASPVLVGTGKPRTNGSAVGISVSGNCAFVASDSNLNTDTGLQVFSIATPASPSQISFTQVPGRSGRAVCATPSVVCYGASGSGLTVFGIGSGASLEVRGWLSESSLTRSVRVYGTSLYVVTNSSVKSQIHTYDITDPADPKHVWSMTFDYPYDVAVSGSYCYVGDSKSLKIINIADQYNPVVVATLAMPDYAQGVFVAGTRAYVACYMAGLAVVDIANPYSPRIVGIVDTPSSALSVSAAGNTAVVADGSAVLTIDVSVASAPRIIGSLPTAATAVNVQVSNGYAYVAAKTAGMLVINISNPASPVLVGTGKPRTNGSAVGISVSSNCAFVASDSNFSSDIGLQVFDIASKESPTQISFLGTTAGRTGSVATYPGYVFFSCETNLARIAQL